ncbi:MAG: sodium:alanine symporter family protein [Anaerococcus sp.]|nr:sodium:alanine symporter family protein [Peptoniphilaceae bacterium]MDY3055047.1 sodium:alanine symporter family protein [Anaerococcus sp.]
MLSQIVASLNSVIRNWFLLIGLLGVGIFYTIYTRGVQFRKLGKAFKLTFGGVFDKNNDGISSFQALAVAIAAQVGTGNVAGTATAIVVGGPGAVFWMWISAILGMSTIFAEATLAQKYREKNNEGYVGGPAYYMKNGIKNKKFGMRLAKVFSVFIIIALGFFGNMTQSNSIATSVNEAFDFIPLILIGIAVAVIAALVFVGGIKRIANFAQLVVPIMALVYIGFSIIIIIKFRVNLLAAFKSIFAAAFTTKAAAGGALGYGIKQALVIGVARGMFSNEAGMGSTPHAHAGAKVNHPVEQGYTAIVGVCISTMIVCTATAIVILSTETHKLGLDGALVTQKAFELGFGSLGKIFLAISLTFFAFTTIIGWYYYGEINVKFLFGDKGLLPYRILVIFFIIWGSTREIALVWNMSDLFNSLMVIPNVIALVLLHKDVKTMQHDYEVLKNSHMKDEDYHWQEDQEFEESL